MSTQERQADICMKIGTSEAEVCRKIIISAESRCAEVSV